MYHQQSWPILFNERMRSGNQSGALITERPHILVDEGKSLGRLFLCNIIGQRLYISRTNHNLNSLANLKLPLQPNEGPELFPILTTTRSLVHTNIGFSFGAGESKPSPTLAK